ncbi:MAG: AraC family transcriptional regulator [Victivallaceae bacterium]
MDFSQQMTRKNTKDFEINASPIPSGFRDSLEKSGMYVCTYYENVASGINQKARQPFDKKNLRRFSFFVVTHLVGGDGVYASDESGRWIDLEPGWGILASPFHSNSYGGKNKSFIEDSIAFNGRTAHALFEAGILKDGLVYIGTERRLLPIINKLRKGTLSALLEANAMLQNLLFSLSHERSSQQPLSAGRKIEHLLLEIQDTTAKWWTVAEMAEYCNISENYLRTLFRQRTGLSPKEYVDNLKMNRAIEMLNNPQIKIYEIAERLGYVDNYHFIRRFSKILGQPPGKYRRNMRRY